MCNTKLVDKIETRRTRATTWSIATILGYHVKKAMRRNSISQRLLCGEATTRARESRKRPWKFQYSSRKRIVNPHIFSFVIDAGNETPEKTMTRHYRIQKLWLAACYPTAVLVEAAIANLA